jgi:sugar phosphate isomerase/epimerase
VTIEVGVFARIFPRPSADEVAGAVRAAGFTTTQLNLSSMGLPTVPPRPLPDLTAIGAAFEAGGVRVWGLSATYNMAHPDEGQRAELTARARDLILGAPRLGAGVVTLCTGTLDPENMWRAHPGNSSPAAWGAMRATLDELLGAADATGVKLGIEPEPGNIVSDALRARRLLDELGGDAGLVGIVLDPANLLTPATLDSQAKVLRHAFAVLGDRAVCLHAKDVVPEGRYAAAGTGGLDYHLVFELYHRLPRSVPVIIQDADEGDVERARRFLLARAAAA